MTILIIGIGLLMCFFGYKLFRGWLALAGLFMGTLIGYYLGGLVGTGAWPVVGAIVMGILLAVLSYSLYQIGAIIIGALNGAVLMSVVLNAFGVAPVWWATLSGAIVGGVIAGMFLKEFIMVGSSFQGSYMAVAGGYALITGQRFFAAQHQYPMASFSFPWYITVIILGLTIFAVWVQVNNEKKPIR